MNLLKTITALLSIIGEKANVVANALSRKLSSGILMHVWTIQLPLSIELCSLNATLAIDNSGALLAEFQVRPSLRDQIRELQVQDPRLQKIRDEVENGKQEDFRIIDEGTLVFRR